MQMKKFQFSGENCFLMCIRNVLDGFMAWYWRNQANGGFAPCREMVSLSSHQVADPGSNWFQHTGQSLLLLYLSSSLAGDIREKSWTFKHATKIVTEPVSVTNICYLLPREWRKVCSDRTNKFKVPGPGVTSHKSGLWQAAKYKPGTTGRLLTPPPWLAGRGLPVFVTKINKWPAGRQIRQLRSGSNIPALVGSPVDIWYLWSFIVIPHSPGDFIYPIQRVQSGLKLGTHFFGSS